MKVKNAVAGLSPLVMALVGWVSGALADPVHQTITVPGGMPGLPIVTGIEQASNTVTVTWDGPPGYYQLYQKTNLEDTWQKFGARTNLARREVLSAQYSNALFRVLGPAPSYAGSRACAECHQATHDSELGTAHAQAFNALKQIQQDSNPACLPCHTVGFGLPTGFTNESVTPHLAGVQCENCHGPAANHAANPDDFTVRPRVELAATTCGGCHTGAQQPHYDEWKTTGHAVVVEDMNPSDRISNCGRCHSGSARMSLLKGKPLPTGDANVPVVCVTCHDPHQKTANPAQLRNPVYSTANYSLSTSDDFASKYDPNIHMCAQCHNDRGAAWTSSSRPPHHSPQYNMLLGSVGVMPDGQAPNSPGAHASLEKQCVTCHMQTKPFVSDAQPAVTGHRFAVEVYDACLACHPYPEALLEFLTLQVMPQNINAVKQALDSWALTKASESLRAKYGAGAWEYTNPGSLSSITSGPTSSEQALIPDNIKKARFDLYLVVNDGSLGVHNPRYSVTLLDTALDWVQAELAK